jgi:hypothetical protein
MLARANAAPAGLTLVGSVDSSKLLKLAGSGLACPEAGWFFMA